MEIKKFEEKYLDSLNELLFQCFSVEKEGKTAQSDIELIAVSEDKVVGYLVLNRMVDSIKDQNYFHVNYVCTHPDFRGQHIATKLFEVVIDICRKENISYLELTLNPSRIAAHHLYHKLGFQVRNTTVFRKEIL